MAKRITGVIEEGQFLIDTFYDRQTRSYVTLIKDAATGFETELLPAWVVTQYSGTRRDAESAIAYAVFAARGPEKK